jgi:hypothetical protein
MGASHRFAKEGLNGIDAFATKDHTWVYAMTPDLNIISGSAPKFSGSYNTRSDRSKAKVKG